MCETSPSCAKHPQEGCTGREKGRPERFLSALRTWPETTYRGHRGLGGGDQRAFFFLQETGPQNDRTSLFFPVEGDNEGVGVSILYREG